MQYLPDSDILCLEYAEYVNCIVTEELYWQQNHRQQLLIHGNGSETLIEYESLPHKYKAKVKAKYGDPYEYAASQPLLRMVKEDMAARQFYAEYSLPDGRPLPMKHQQIYSRQCDWLNLIDECMKDKGGLKKMLHLPVMGFWGELIKLLKNDKIEHKLPYSERRLREKHCKYTTGGYRSLIELYKFCNDNARVVTPKIEELLLALYAQRNGRTTLTQVVKDYGKFISGGLELVDLTTGELFNRNDFRVKDNYYELAPATVSYYANMKHNRERIDLMKLGSGDYTQKNRFYNKRSKPRYAFSIVSMDDYLPPFKTLDGKRTVWMYAIFDVASTAIIGVAYGKDKTFNLVREAMGDMVRKCLENGWGLPLELEMERSLNYEHRGTKENPDIFTDGAFFSHVRFVRGGNSQGKIVERFLGDFKYSELIKEDGFLGRPHGRNENFRYNSDQQEGRYTAEELVKRLKEYVQAYNNAACPASPSLSEGGEEVLSRWEWLCENMNPECVKHKPEILMPAIGQTTKTSIYRYYAQVQGNDYEVPLGSLDRFRDSAGRVNCDAYYLPDENGAIDKVYLYQNGKFICEAEPAESYNYATAERTAEDWAIMQRQTAKQKEQMKRAKEGLAKIPMVASFDPSLKGGAMEEAIKYAHVEYDKLAQETEAYEAVNGASTSLSDPKSAEMDEINWEEYAKNSL